MIQSLVESENAFYHFYG